MRSTSLCILKKPLALARDAGGSTATEYVIVATLVAVAALGAFELLGDATSAKVRCATGALGGGGGPCTVAGRGDGSAPIATTGSPPARAESREERAAALVRAAGGAGDRERDFVARQLATLPDEVLAALESQGTEIVVTFDSVARAYPALRNVHPRGAPEDFTFDDVPGVFDPSSNRVVVALDAEGGFAGGDGDVLAHEIGHALDLPRGGSESNAFRAAYARTTLEGTRADREEAYADSFADFLRHPEELRESFRPLYEYWAAHARAFGESTAGAMLAAARTDPALRPFGWDDLHPAHAAGAIKHHVVDRVGDVLQTAGRFTVLGAAIEHGPGLAESVGGWAWNDSPLGGVARASFDAMPNDVRNAMRVTAGFATGVAEFGASLATLAYRYSPITPQGMYNSMALIARAARHPGRTWKLARAMPAQTVSYYGGLIDDVRSGDPFQAGRAAGLLSTDAAMWVVPGGAAASRGASFARVAAMRARAGAALRADGGWADHFGFSLQPVPRAAPPLPARHLTGPFDDGTAFDRPRGLCFAAGTEVHLGAGGAAPIESLRVGMRVRTLGADDARAATDVDESWRLVKMSMPDPAGSGDVFEITLLRPAEWIAELGAREHSAVHLALREMGVEGAAVIEAIERAPEIERGPGHVVLATVESTTERLLALRFDGTSEILEPTESHPLYSLDRGAWVRAGELHPGERLRAASGAVTIAEITRVGGAHRVYNLEVETEHSFLVSRLEVLSHNNNPCATPDDFAEWHYRVAGHNPVPRVAPDPFAPPLGVNLTETLDQWIQSSPKWSAEVRARLAAGWKIVPALDERTMVYPSREIHVGTRDPGAGLARALEMASYRDANPQRSMASFPSADEYVEYATEYSLREQAHGEIFAAQVSHELTARGATPLVAHADNTLSWLQLDDPIQSLANAFAEKPMGHSTVRATLAEHHRTQWNRAHSRGADGDHDHADDQGDHGDHDEHAHADEDVEAELGAEEADGLHAPPVAPLAPQLTREVWRGAEAVLARTREFEYADVDAWQAGVERAVEEAIDRAGMAGLRVDRTHPIYGTVVLDGRTGAIQRVAGHEVRRRSGRPAGPRFVVGHRMLREGVHSGIARGSYQIGVEDGRAVVRYWFDDGHELDHGSIRIRMARQ